MATATVNGPVTVTAMVDSLVTVMAGKHSVAAAVDGLVVGTEATSVTVDSSVKGASDDSELVTVGGSRCDSGGVSATGNSNSRWLSRWKPAR
jgi:hypothetical protein